MPIIVCAPADPSLEIPGSSYDRFCSRCGCRLMIAPSGQAFLLQHPAAQIVCLRCHLGSPVDPDEEMAVAGDAARVLAEMATARPNMRRHRN